MKAERNKYQSSGRLTGENTHGHEAMLPFITSIWTPFTLIIVVNACSSLIFLPLILRLLCPPRLLSAMAQGMGVQNDELW